MNFCGQNPVKESTWSEILCESEDFTIDKVGCTVLPHWPTDSWLFECNFCVNSASYTANDYRQSFLPMKIRQYVAYVTAA